MSWSLDARIPLLLAADRASLGQMLREGGPAAILAELPFPDLPPGAVGQERFEAGAPHAGGCACCGGRSAAATALDRLFQARVKGRMGWFQRVIALAPGEAAQVAVLAALHDDAVTRARFRAG
jgi:hypothetical protein